MIESGRWAATIMYWLLAFDKPVHVLVYEELKTNTMLEAYRMMKFVNVTVTLQSLYCMQLNPQEKYLRRGQPVWMTSNLLFNNTKKLYVNSIIESVRDSVSKSWNLHDVFEKYILD